MASLMCFLLTGRPLAPRPFRFVSCCVLTFCLSGFIVSFRFLSVFMRFVCFSLFSLSSLDFFFVFFSSHFRFWIWSYKERKERKKKKGGSHSKRLLVGSFCPVCFFSWFPVSVGESIFAVSSVFIVEKLSMLPQIQSKG